MLSRATDGESTLTDRERERETEHVRLCCRALARDLGRSIYAIVSHDPWALLSNILVS